jgi:hypothetical protein
MVRDYLSVLGISVSVAVFSTARDITSKKRNRLIGESFRMLMLIKSWLRLICMRFRRKIAGYVADIEAFKLVEMLM